MEWKPNRAWGWFPFFGRTYWSLDFGRLYIYLYWGP